MTFIYFFGPVFPQKKQRTAFDRSKSCNISQIKDPLDIFFETFIGRRKVQKVPQIFFLDKFTVVDIQGLSKLILFRQKCKIFFFISNFFFIIYFPNWNFIFRLFFNFYFKIWLIWNFRDLNRKKKIYNHKIFKT